MELASELGRMAWPGGESSWGKSGVWLIPIEVTEIHGRSDFSIHGGDTPDSAGCIDHTSDIGSNKNSDLVRLDRISSTW